MNNPKPMKYRIINDTIKQNAIKAISELSLDDKYVVSIDKDKHNRTNRQNAYLWGVVYKTIVDDDPGFFFSEQNEIAIRSAGIKREEAVHEFCKMQFLHSVEINGIKMTASTAKLKTDEFNEYVENIRRWASSFLAIDIPDPHAVGYTDLRWV